MSPKDDGSAYSITPVWTLLTVDADGNLCDNIGGNECELAKLKGIADKQWQSKLDWCETRCEGCGDLTLEARSNGKVVYEITPYYLLWLDGPDGEIIGDEPIGDDCDINELKALAEKHAKDAKRDKPSLKPKTPEPIVDEPTKGCIQTFWLSFTDETGFLGVVIVDSDTFINAVKKTHQLAINPGGQVAWGDPPEGVFEVDKNRLLSRAEAESLLMPSPSQ
jgi:hypothetical protein